MFPPTADGAGSLDDPGFAGGPRRQVEHLLQRGATRLAFAGSDDPRVRDPVPERRALATQTITAEGRHFVGDADLSQSIVSEQLRAWLADGVDGIVAYNDDIAAMAVGAALRARVEVPGQLKVVGHDDSPLARLFVPALSSVRVDTAGLGRFLAQIALSAATGSTPPTAGPETDAVLVAREST